jgi:hypothetical protein
MQEVNTMHRVFLQTLCCFSHREKDWRPCWLCHFFLTKRNLLTHTCNFCQGTMRVTSSKRRRGGLSLSGLQWKPLLAPGSVKNCRFFREVIVVSTLVEPPNVASSSQHHTDQTPPHQSLKQKKQPFLSQLEVQRKKLFKLVNYVS